MDSADRHTSAFLTGYIIPFLLVLSLLVFVHEMGHYLVGRWSGIRILAFSVGFGPELARLYRQARHALEDLRPFRSAATSDSSATRMPRASPISTALDAMSAGGPRPYLCRRQALEAGGDRRCRSDRQFPSRDRDLRRAFLDLWPHGRRSGRRRGQAGQRCRRSRHPARRPARRHRRQQGRRPSTTCAAMSASARNRRSSSTIERKGEKLDLPMVPKRTEITDQFGNKMEIGLIGIVTNQEAGNFRLQTFTPLEALRAGRDRDLAHCHRHLQIYRQSRRPAG